MQISIFLWVHRHSVNEKFVYAVQEHDQVTILDLTSNILTSYRFQMDTNWTLYHVHYSLQDSIWQF